MDLFLASQHNEEAPFLGDGWAWHRLWQLGLGSEPLVEPAGPTPWTRPPPTGDGAFAVSPIQLTDAGRAVLAGQADRVHLTGLDRWLGGTRLRAEAGAGTPVWRWDAGTARLVHG